MQITNEYHGWALIPKFIYKLKSLQPKESVENSDTHPDGNTAILLLLPVWVESMMYTVIKQVLLTRKGLYNTTLTVEGRMIQSALEKLEEATLNDYENLSKVILEKSFPDIIGNEKWKGIKTLFQFRNDIIHGKPFKQKITADDTEVFGKHKNVKNYLLEKKVITSPKAPIYTAKTIEHFIELVENTTQILADTIEDVETTSVEGEIFVYYSFKTEYKDFMSYLKKVAP
jgi:hypothetical protein